jgi:hypothetical protein
MGAPTYQYGLSYGVGTCRAGGVRHSHPLMTCCQTGLTDHFPSSMRVPRASNAHLLPRSRAIAMALTPTAATATTQPRTTTTALCTGHRLSLLSRASSAAAVAVAVAAAAAAAVLRAARPRPQGRRRRPRVVGQTVPQCTASAVAKGGLVRPAARLGAARLPTATTPNACRRKLNIWVQHVSMYSAHC